MVKMDMELDMLSEIPHPDQICLHDTVFILLVSLAAVIPHRASLGKQLGLPDCKPFHLHKASCGVG